VDLVKVDIVGFKIFEGAMECFNNLVVLKMVGGYLGCVNDLVPNIGQSLS